MALSPMNNQNGCGGRLAANRSTSRHNHHIVTGLFWCAVLCLVTVSADAQLLSFGVKGGIPLNDAFLFTSLGTIPPRVAVTRESHFSKTRRYVVGPTVQVHLPLRLALEFNVLYRRLNYDRNFYTRTPSSGEHFVNTHNVANKWEFPLLMKYRFSDATVRPFVAAGVSVNRINGTRQVRDTGSRTFTEWYYTRNVSQSGFALEELARFPTGGFVLGGGVEMPLSFIRITAEMRYTRWAHENFREETKWFGTPFGSNLNQADFLLGISF